MVSIVAAIACILTATSLYAQDEYRRFPRYYEVSGISPGDALNVRAGPSTQFRDIGNLRPDGSPVEILSYSEDVKWGRLVWGEGNGWVFLDFLKPIFPEKLSGVEVPIGLMCSGTEPFWDFTIASAAEVQFNMLFSDTVASAAIDAAVVADSRPTTPVAVIASSEQAELMAILDRQQCTDGMTDREYGWSVDLLVTQQNSPRFLTGCCTL